MAQDAFSYEDPLESAANGGVQALPQQSATTSDPINSSEPTGANAEAQEQVNIKEDINIGEYKHLKLGKRSNATHNSTHVTTRSVV